MAVIGVVIGVIGQPSTLAALAGDTVPVLLVGRGHAGRQHGRRAADGAAPGVSPLTGMLALTAGGASGLTAITRELGGDERVVAVVQYLRVGMVIATMPVVAAAVRGHRRRRPAPAAAPARRRTVVRRPGFLLVAAGAGVGLARLTRMPAGGLLGPTGSSRSR